ncbi:hypothetical protein NFI96_007294 [Prochilodus magdalenae]|nr:hypothetical protein NFI96_007294 [Prochilodus magdalenae]
MTALKELESDEENVSPDRTNRNGRSSVQAKATAAGKAPLIAGAQASKTEPDRVRKKKKKLQQVFSSSENEEDSLIIKDKRSSVFRPSVPVEDRRSKRELAALPPLGRFVTRRRRALPVPAGKPTSKQSCGISNSSLNSSSDFASVVPSVPRCVTRRKRTTVLEELRQENPGPKPSAGVLSGGHSESYSALREVSLNDNEERRMSCKRPLLCSTPSLDSRRNLRYVEPSVSEISSFSCDEQDKPPGRKASSSGLPVKPRRSTVTQDRRQRSSCVQEVKAVVHAEEHSGGALLQQELDRCGERTEDGVETKGEMACEDDQTSASVVFVSAQTHVDSLAEQLKKRCRLFGAVVPLEKVDVMGALSKQSPGEKPDVQEEMWLPCLETEPSTSGSLVEIGHGNQTNDSSDCALFRSLYVTSSSSPSSSLPVPPRSSPPAHELADSAQALIDCLKAECLSSCLTVSLLPLDRSLLRRVQQAPREVPETRPASPLPPETKRDDKGLKRSLHSGNAEKLSSEGERSSGSEGQAAGVVRRLSASFGLSAVSPVAAPSRAHAKGLPKERSAAGTSRKACVSGLSISRWSKRDMGERNKKQRKNETRTRTKPGESSLMFLLPARTNGESACSSLPGNSALGLPVTPTRMEQLNLSNSLALFSPDMLTTHNWGRLKAALSIHKRKTAFPTPRQLSLSNMRSPGGMDCSLDLFGASLSAYTPLSKLTPSRLLRSTMTTNASVGPDAEDISDAEKVYHECQQDGPVSFDDCIPPKQMKCCTKIGEGTFGEVFSTVTDSNQTVALKIIPVEGPQKVNGEPQKTFGEILHEIIISKELSSLNSKENNQTNGFIGLNNLHCVRGSYPSTLLKAWDKFDREKESENDRPGRVGPTFYTGRVGPTFYTGRVGPTFYTGRVGPTFYTGRVGPTFYTGRVGPTLYTGRVGPTLYTGRVGPTLYTGRVGPTFYTGRVGPTFYTGRVGPTFYTGRVGPTFYTGRVGPTFYTGRVGPTFYTGRVGPTFYTGRVGPTFYTGRVGPAFYSRGERGPHFFGEDQLFVILEFEFGGSDLENMNGKLFSMGQAKSILHQVTAALAVAEQALYFEHRDLHWGNILVKTTKEKSSTFVLNGVVYSVETRGVHVNIIDYSLSRLEIGVFPPVAFSSHTPPTLLLSTPVLSVHVYGLTVSCDIANDEELFMGQGDYQFEIYRLMKKENNNCWADYNPHSNVLWLHYVVDKLLTMKYKAKAQTVQQKRIKSSLQAFKSEILSYRSATEALMHCSLFQLYNRRPKAHPSAKQGWGQGDTAFKEGRHLKYTVTRPPNYTPSHPVTTTRQCGTHWEPLGVATVPNQVRCPDGCMGLVMKSMLTAPSLGHSE